MNRIGLKNASKQCIRDTKSRPRVTTLIYLVIIYIINLLVNRVSSGSVFDMDFLQSIVDMDLVDMFSTGLFGTFSSAAGLVVFVNILSSLVISVLDVGYYNYCLRLSRGNATGFSDVFTALNQTVKVIWLTIIMIVYIFLWSLLFVIPGFVAAYRYSMAYYALMNDPSLTASQALNVSKQITKGHKMQLFTLDLSFIGWYFLCNLTFGILYIWKLPYIETTKAHAFNWLMSLSYPPAGGNDYTDPGNDCQGPEIL